MVTTENAGKFRSTYSTNAVFVESTPRNRCETAIELSLEVFRDVVLKAIVAHGWDLEANSQRRLLEQPTEITEGTVQANRWAQEPFSTDG